MSNSSNFVSITADTLSDALVKAGSHLGLPIDEIKYEIIEQKDKIKIKIFLNEEKNIAEKNDFSKTIDGYFKIRYRDGCATLTVFAPIDGGREVYAEDVVKRMKLLNIPKIEYDLIKKIVNEATGKPFSISPWPRGEEFRPDIKVRVSEDKIRAFVEVCSPKNGVTEATADDILFELETNNVRYGIDIDKINEIALKKIYGKEVEVASGLLPSDEENEYYKPLFDTNPGKPFLADEYDRINLKELNFIQNKKSGEEVAVIYPKKEGRNGIDVFGEIIPFNKDERLKPAYGENLQISSDGDKILTIIDGHCYLDKNTILIEPLAVFDNVDYKSGNVDFIGSVLINQSVTDGFYIKAKGSIQIGQSVGKVRLESEKDIILKAGINGSGEGTIICKGDLYAKFIEGANIVCHGNLFVEEAIMNSNVKVDKNAILVGRRAEIISGSLIVGNSLRCKKFGNVSNTKTIATLGIIPEKFEMIEELLNNIENMKNKIIEIENNIQRLEKTKKSSPELIDKIEEAYEKLIINRERTKEQIFDMEREYKEARFLLVPEKKCMAVIESILYPNSSISFGEIEYKSSDKETSKIILKFVNGKIKEEGYNYRDEIKFNLD
ncbi:MAG TPA: FapA family protein [Spirochaetota bacterium]|nr:FapA family protein [Spirochaetota bacterium]